MATDDGGLDWADVQCHPLERELTPWTYDTVAKYRDAPVMEAELARIQSHFVAEEDEPTVWGSVEQRVPRYASALLRR